jgi:hypothetical protein
VDLMSRVLEKYKAWIATQSDTVLGLEVETSEELITLLGRVYQTARQCPPVLDLLREKQRFVMDLQAERAAHPLHTLVVLPQAQDGIRERQQAVLANAAERLPADLHALMSAALTVCEKFSGGADWPAWQALRDALAAYGLPTNPAPTRTDPASCPDIVVLCGPTRFRETYRQANAVLTIQNKIVLSCGVFKGDPEVGAAPKGMLDELHLRKIELADEVVLIGGRHYAGESTLREIAHAERIGLPIREWRLEPRDIAAMVQVTPKSTPALAPHPDPAPPHTLQLCVVIDGGHTHIASYHGPVPAAQVGQIDAAAQMDSPPAYLPDGAYMVPVAWEAAGLRDLPVPGLDWTHATPVAAPSCGVASVGDPRPARRIPATRQAASDELLTLISDLGHAARFISLESGNKAHRAVFLLGALDQAHDQGFWPDVKPEVRP